MLFLRFLQTTENFANFIHAAEPFSCALVGRGGGVVEACEEGDGLLDLTVAEIFVRALLELADAKELAGGAEEVYLGVLCGETVERSAAGANGERGGSFDAGLGDCVVAEKRNVLDGC